MHIHVVTGVYVNYGILSMIQIVPLPLVILIWEVPLSPQPMVEVVSLSILIVFCIVSLLARLEPGTLSFNNENFYAFHNIIAPVGITRFS